MIYREFLWNEFLFGGHWGSIGASAVALSTMILLNLKIRWEFLLIAYLGTQCIYNYNHFKELEIDALTNSTRVEHLKNYKALFPLIVSFYGLSYFIILIFFGNFNGIIFGSALLFIGLLFTYKGKRISTKVIGFKSLYASFSWALLVPFISFYYSYPINTSVFLISVFIFLRIVINTNFFDIKDIECDKQQGLLTLPIVFRDKILLLNFLHLLNFISFIPILFGVIVGLLPIYSVFSILLFLYSFYYLLKAKNKKTDIQSFSYVFVDGEFYYWPLFLFIGLILKFYNIL